MLSALTLPLVALLLALPGIPHIPGLPGFGMKDLNRLRHKTAAPLDSLPPAWKPASLLALEDQFVQAALPDLAPEPVGLAINQDPRQLRVSFDTDSSVVLFSTQVGEFTVGDVSRVPISDYSHDLTQRTFQRLWADKTRQSFAAGPVPGATTAPHSGGLVFDLPSPLPKRIQSLLGPGGPSLSVSGSENIRLSGTSNWTNQQITALGQSRSLFPSLDMQQDLNIRLEGRLSDRVGVNLLQNSANQIPLENRVAINYKGDEDDLIQALDLGNTNLTLPGTQYVSYSGKNEGLFGMKATTRLGPLDFTVLASKQEGRSERASYQGGSSRQTPPPFYDKDYVRGVYFFLYDPNLPARVIDESSIVLYQDEGTYNTDVNTTRGRAFVDPNNVCLDSLQCGADTTRSAHGTFHQLRGGADQDYEILGNLYGPLYKVIRLRTGLTGDGQRLAVTYRYRLADQHGVATGDSIRVGGQSDLDRDGIPATRMQLLRPRSDELPATTDHFYITDPKVSPFAQVRELELKNIYQLSGQKIDPKTFMMTVRQGDFVPAHTSVIEGPNNAPYTVPYIEMLGLDDYDESNGTPVRAHDGFVDGTTLTSNFGAWVDFERGLVFLPDPRPFAPRIAADSTGRPFDRAISALLLRRDSLVAVPPALGADPVSNASNPAIYEKSVIDPQDRIYAFDVQFTAAVAGSDIMLGRTNIIQGSDVVKINGQELARDKDYRIDYDLGRVTLIRQMGPSDQLSIDYSYAPLFQQAAKTLIGNAFRWEGKQQSFGGAFMYESNGAQDLRPRLGEEPSRNVIGDLNTEWHFKPDWVTRAVNSLPGVRTTAPSELNVQAEVGASSPNPNTSNQVYIDDMEGVRDAVTLSMGPERWKWTSIPIDSVGREISDLSRGTAQQQYAEIHWYAPLNVVKERDLKPSLTDAQGAQNPHQVLALSIPKRPDKEPSPQALWTGLTYPLDPVGIDLSHSQFIEIWVNDFRDHHNYTNPEPVNRVRGDHVKLHLDLGTVSEDEQRAPNILPNRRLDTEDKLPRDGQLVVTDENNEDTGLDGQLDGAETPQPNNNPAAPDSVFPDLKTAEAEFRVNPNDLSGDDFEQPDTRFKDWDPMKWLHTNGTEGDKNLVPVPESEDLNNNNSLDLEQSYFEYTVDLGDSLQRYLVTDVYETYKGAGYTNHPGEPIPIDNGWRRYRIPITDSLRVQMGSPNLTQARHLRLWLENVENVDSLEFNDPQGKPDGRPLVALGGLEIVGARWVANTLDSTAVRAGTTVTINTVNTIDNADIYQPPFDPGQTRNGNQEVTRREQSLALEFTSLPPHDTLEVFKTFSLDEDYSRYGKLDFYAAGYNVENYSPLTDSLFFFVRFASDERGTSYYEYRSPVPLPSSAGHINWRQILLTLTDLSSLKLQPNFPKNPPILYRAPGKLPGEEYVIRGQPSFTRLRRISFGIMNESSNRTFNSGQVWLDEMRATDVARDLGTAQRILVNGSLSNLMRYNLTWNGNNADFQSVGQSRGSGNNQSQIAFQTGIDLNRFFEASRIILPVNFSYNGSQSQPRFTAGDDVIRTGALAEGSDTRNSGRTLSTSYSRSWSDRSNPLLRYTLGGVTANWSRTDIDNRNPLSFDALHTTNAGVNYSVAPRQWLKIPLGRKITFFPLPERFTWNYSVMNTVSNSVQRIPDSTGFHAPIYSTIGHQANVQFGADTRPFDFFHHSFSASRNLALDPALMERLGFVNFGKVVGWNQQMDARYQPMKLGPWLKPNLSWNSRYGQANGPELSPDLSVRAITNNQTVNATWDLPFDQMGNTAPGDTTHRGVPAWKHFLSRLGPVGSDAQFNSSSAHSRTEGTADFLYMMGLKQNPGYGSTDSTGKVTQSFGNRSDVHTDWRFGAHTTFLLLYGSTVLVRSDYGQTSTGSNGVSSRSNRVHFPTLEVNYGKLPDVLGLKRFLLNPTIKTSYDRTQQVDYSNSDTPTGVSTSSAWQPLFDVSGDLKNGTRCQLRVERRVSETENRLSGLSTTIQRNTTVNFSVNRSYSKGQKVTILGKESTVRSNINVGMTTAYERQSGGTFFQGLTSQPTDIDRLSVNAQGGYSFSSNVTGNLELGFGQNRNLLLKTVNRSVRVELRAQFTF